MSKADKIFEESGYIKTIDNEIKIKYEYKNIIMGERIEQTILFAKVGKIIFSYINDNNRQNVGIGIKELQAINEKVKELGWNE